MLTLLLTCAGKSTRFPGYRPKWSLTHPSGDMMVAEAIKGIGGYDRLVAVFNQTDCATFGAAHIAREFALAGFSDVEIIDVGETASQVETVARAVERAGIVGSFTVRDCDSYFRLALRPGNRVAVAGLQEAVRITPGNKSYVRSGVDATLVEIAEKQVISSLYCCGAYTFRDPSVFNDSAEGCTYLSEVIGQAMQRGETFYYDKVEGYADWGTAEDWALYRQDYKTIFCDIDGVLVESSHRSFVPSWGTTAVIEKNIEYLNQLHATGRVEVVLITARPEALRSDTERQLAGLQYDRLIMGLRVCPRYLVNDYALSRGELTAFAINLPRDSMKLEECLRVGR